MGKPINLIDSPSSVIWKPITMWH